MKDEKIQTLHPQPGKTNKLISLAKYKVIKTTILSILSEGEPTHTELMEQIYAEVKDTFEGGVQWDGETPRCRATRTQRLAKSIPRYRANPFAWFFNIKILKYPRYRATTAQRLAKQIEDSTPRCRATCIVLKKVYSF